MSSSSPPSPPPDAAMARSRGKNKRRDIPQERWTQHHPDLAADFDQRKSRRKSMSDVRHPRVLDENSIDLSRRDSLEDAVSDFLRAPRLTRITHHPVTGRTIAYSEVGDPDGAAVFICVGMGLTRYVTAFYDELATTLRLRLITIDRPGVGASDAYPPGDRSGPLNWPDEVLAICQDLAISQFSLLAHSAGAVYALATALILPHLIKGKVHLLAPWIPPSQLEAVPHATRAAPPAGSLPRGQRILRVLPASFLKAANSSFVNVTSASLKPASKRQIQAARAQQDHRDHSSPAAARPSTRDRTTDHHRRESMMLMDQYMPTLLPTENFPVPLHNEKEDADVEMPRSSLFLSATATPTDPSFTFASTGLNAAEHSARQRKQDFSTRLTQRTWEAATRDSNPATDLLVCLERSRDVGFRYTDVGVSVVITHGAEDKRVPVGNVRWVAEQMNVRASMAGIGMGVGIGGGGVGGVPSPSSANGESWADGRVGGCEVRVLKGEGHGPYGECAGDERCADGDCRVLGR